MALDTDRYLLAQPDEHGACDVYVLTQLHSFEKAYANPFGFSPIAKLYPDKSSGCYSVDLYTYYEVTGQRSGVRTAFADHLTEALERVARWHESGKAIERETDNTMVEHMDRQADEHAAEQGW